MSTWLQDLINRHSPSGILVDTNLLLLYLVGKIDKNLISRFRRTNTFIADDFDLLEQLLIQFQKLITTPHILTEVSDLGESIGTRFFDRLAKNISVMDERMMAATEICPIAPFLKIGLPDTAIFALSKHHLVLTDDFRLSQTIDTSGGHVINFNHIRMLNWQ